MDRSPAREPAPPADARLQKSQQAFVLVDWKCGKMPSRDRSAGAARSAQATEGHTRYFFRR